MRILAQITDEDTEASTGPRPGSRDAAAGSSIDPISGHRGKTVGKMLRFALETTSWDGFDM